MFKSTVLLSIADVMTVTGYKRSRAGSIVAKINAYTEKQGFMPEITIKIIPAELSTNDDVIGYCKKISEELAATSKLRLEVELKV